MGDYNREGFEKKTRNNIAPLRLPTLAAFLPWGSSEGAGRMSLAPQTYKQILSKQ